MAERRVTSVLFGDLVGFTTLSESRDAEDVRELLSQYFGVARTVIERYGGTVEKFIGDAVMAVWGVPSAHEDDAERAVRAGFDLVDAVASLGEEVGAADLAMRVGVVTGEVAVTLGATGEGMVAGDAVNTAARVQASAARGEVWVDDATRELTVAAVSYADAGTHELKGKSEPMHLFRAQQVIGSVGGVRRIDGLEAPFSGRDRELRMLKELFHACIEEGRPRLVSVVGPIGVGKSRMGWELDKYTDGIEAVVRAHRGRCLSYGEGVAFWALSEIIRGRLELLEGDAADVVTQRLHVAMDEYVPDPQERAWLVPRLAMLLGVGDATSRSFARDDLFAAWRTFLERVAVTEAVGAVVHIDDLQWADAGLLEFLETLIETAQAPIFLVTFSRPEIAELAPTFGTGRRATTIYLEPLPERAMKAVVDGLVDGLPDQVRNSLVSQSEGIPLFAVETVRSLIDRDAVIPREGRYVLAPDADQRVDLQELALPTSLHTLVASRLDALPLDERRTVQDAAVLGQAFTRNGLATVQAAVGTHLDLDAMLDALVRKEVLAVESDPRSPERGQYRFVQAVVRAVAYETLAKRDRKVRHLAAVDHLALEPDADSIPGVLARHLLDARAAAPNDPDADNIARRAVELLERAGAHALDLGAPTEALGHLDAALAFAGDDMTTARLLEESARASVAAGHLLDGIERAKRSREAYEALGLEVDAARALAFWGEAHILSGTGPVIVEPLSAAYEHLRDRPGADAAVAAVALQVARAHYLSIGDTAAAITWFDRAVVLGEALEDLPFLAQALASYAGALVLVGRQRMGIGLLRVALDLARQLDQPKQLLLPLNNLACFLATRDVEAAKDYVDEGFAVVRRLGDREWAAGMVATACHLHWAAGKWDLAIALVDEFVRDAEHTTVQQLIRAYLSAINTARGEPIAPGSPSANPLGLRTDILAEATQLFLDAARARASGELITTAERSAAAMFAYASSSGLDDDFPLFWITAVEDSVAAGDVTGTEKLLDIVVSAPRGHLVPHVRAQLLRLRAMLANIGGPNTDVEADLVAAISALDQFGARFYAACTRVEYCRWLCAHGRAAEATPLLEEARSTFTALRATPWLAQVSELSSISVG
ncbi:MAG: adenylate/guanylate cyclase domain-containing protein [Actinomycetes bacterium]